MIRIINSILQYKIGRIYLLRYDDVKIRWAKVQKWFYLTHWSCKFYVWPNGNDTKGCKQKQWWIQQNQCDINYKQEIVAEWSHISLHLYWTQSINKLVYVTINTMQTNPTKLTTLAKLNLCKIAIIVIITCKWFSHPY